MQCRKTLFLIVIHCRSCSLSSYNDEAITYSFTLTATRPPYLHTIGRVVSSSDASTRRVVSQYEWSTKQTKQSWNLSWGWRPLFGFGFESARYTQCLYINLHLFCSSSHYLSHIFGKKNEFRAFLLQYHCAFCIFSNQSSLTQRMHSQCRNHSCKNQAAQYMPRVHHKCCQKSHTRQYLKSQTLSYISEVFPFSQTL